MRILFVENHAVFAHTVVEEFLGGLEVVIVPSLAEASQQLAAGAFEAVLVDFDLDDGKGVELVAELRRRRFAGKIVAVSAHEEGSAKLLAAGADTVCKKADFRRIRDHLR
jgi:DNA-binding response OmpR family regulator